MSYGLIAIASTLGLVSGMLALLELGRRTGARRVARHGGDANTGVGAIDGAVFALLGLLLAFTFSGAASRFDFRRSLIVDEANDIGTAYLRVDLVPPDAQPPLRDAFRRYVDSRIDAYRKVPDAVDVADDLAQWAAIQKEIWALAVAASRMPAAQPSAPMLLLPAVNGMIDITTTRTVAARSHPPPVVFAMLLVLVMVASFLAGHAMAVGKERGWSHMLCFAVVTSAAVYVILDFEFPRLGLIRIDAFDHVLVDVRAGMN